MSFLKKVEKITGLTGVKLAQTTVKKYLDDSGRSMDSRTCQMQLRDSNETLIALFYIAAFPGCCGMCISFNTYVDSRFQRKGLGQLLMKMKEQIAYEGGYTVMVATDVVKHLAQTKIFQRAKWVKADEFVNRRTQNNVGIYTRRLADTGIPLGCQQPQIVNR